MRMGWIANPPKKNWETEKERSSDNVGVFKISYFSKNVKKKFKFRIALLSRQRILFFSELNLDCDKIDNRIDSKFECNNFWQWRWWEKAWQWNGSLVDLMNGGVMWMELHWPTFALEPSPITIPSSQSLRRSKPPPIPLMNHPERQQRGGEKEKLKKSEYKIKNDKNWGEVPWAMVNWWN